MYATLNPSYRLARLGCILSAVTALLIIPAAFAEEGEASAGMGFGGVRAQVCPAPETAPEEVRVYKLDHADASFLARLLRDTLPVRTLVADPRINSLIVSGSRESITKLEAILPNLDVHSVSDERHVRVYVIRHRPVDDALQQMLVTMLSDRSARIAMDSARSLVIVSGHHAHHRMVQEILAELDTPVAGDPAAERAAPSDRQFMDYRFFWLLSGADLGAPGEVPEELQEVIQEMGALGIADLHLITQNTVRTGEGTFELEMGPANRASEKWSMAIRGKTAWIEEGRPTLDIQLTGVVPGGEVPHASFAMNLSPLMGRPTAIAFPHGDRTSVFVVLFSQPLPPAR